MYQGKMSFAQWSKNYGGIDSAVWLGTQYIALGYDSAIKVERLADHQVLSPDGVYVEDVLDALALIIGDESGDCWAFTS